MKQKFQSYDDYIKILEKIPLDVIEAYLAETNTEMADVMRWLGR